MSSEETRHAHPQTSRSSTDHQDNVTPDDRCPKPAESSLPENVVEATINQDSNQLEAGNTDFESQPSTPVPSVLSKSKHLHLSEEESMSSRQRRSSSRSIKRKKFDDELVESSILTPKAQRNRTLSTSLTAPTVPGSAVSSTGGSPSSVISVPSTSKPPSTGTPCPTETQPPPTCMSPVHSVPPPLPVETPIASVSGLKSSQQPIAVSNVETSVKKAPAKPVISGTVNRRRLRIAHNNAVKDLGRWKPQDDLALVLAVQQTNDLEQVYRGVKFSSKFTLQEIEQRWYVLLYDPTIAKIGVAAMRQLHPDVIAQVYAKALFSEEEECLLKAITVASRPTLETFQQLLEKYIDVFVAHRTAKTLKTHWTLLKHYQLLQDQTVTSTPATSISSVVSGRCEEMRNFSDMEEHVERELIASLSNPSSLFRSEEAINQELMLSNRKCIREIRQLENEIPRWQVLVDSITGVAPSDFDNETLAVLRGRLVRYLMRSREITLGRCTQDSLVDVDLSLEGPSDKISRKQALIKLTANGEFIITNVGKRAFHVDSKPVLGNLCGAKLFNNSVVEIAGLRFVFLVNQDLIAAVRAEALKSHM
jgi:microspherule protein 1